MSDRLPLAAQLRPKDLDEYIGQAHLVGEGKPLRRALDQGQVYSMMLWGPPGSGKTSLARLIANYTKRPFIELSAVSAGKADIRTIVEGSDADKTKPAPVLFLDEIHRFNKAQQDFLLPFVEQGRIILIGATTENPSFEVIPALLSRSRVFVLEALSEADLTQVIERARVALQLAKLTPDTQTWLITYANGDARKLLTIIEHTHSSYGELTPANLQAAIQDTFLRYDKKGEEHYDTISAFIKSMRASNTDAALYYLARMVAAGEDPQFIARRMVIFASEDIGLAQPTALVVANAVFEAVSKIGYPEAQINLAHGVAYLARCAKDRSAHDAYFEALTDVKQLGNLPIPMSLRNAPTKLMKSLGYGKNYDMYPPADAELLPEKLKKRRYLKAKPSAK